MIHYKQRSISIKIRMYISLVLCIMFVSPAMLAQRNNLTDSTETVITYDKDESNFASDTGYIQTQALDIGSDRGLFIMSPDKKMQLRILGSVRGAFNYTDQDLSSKSSLNPYEIPTNINTISPNYYASLSQTRLGFEVTRQTKKRGDVFIRIEADFASFTNVFRLRHAYGQFTHLIVGQTWSLFSNVSYQPATVSFDGVAGSISSRTPQIRFMGDISPKFKYAAAIEYSLPDFSIPDSVKATPLQVIPDFTGKISLNTEVFNGSLAAILTTISGRENSDEISYGFGYGGSVSGEFKINTKNKIFFSFTGGQAISHYIGMLGGQQEDIAYNPEANEFVVLPSTSGFLGYKYDIMDNLFLDLMAGFIAIDNKDFQADNAFSHCYNALVNLFWEPVEGARIGLEYINGRRFDKGGQRGKANKYLLLMYYDF